MFLIKKKNIIFSAFGDIRSTWVRFPVCAMLAKTSIMSLIHKRFVLNKSIKIKI